MKQALKSDVQHKECVERRQRTFAMSVVEKRGAGAKEEDLAQVGIFDPVLKYQTRRKTQHLHKIPCEAVAPTGIRRRGLWHHP